MPYNCSIVSALVLSIWQLDGSHQASSDRHSAVTYAAALQVEHAAHGPDQVEDDPGRIQADRPLRGALYRRQV